MSAGNATPSDAMMMWKPSVNAIWLRAASAVEAARGSASSTGRSDLDGRSPRRGVLGPVDARRAAAVEHLRSAVAGEVVRRPRHERVDARRHAGHHPRVPPEARREGDDAVQLMAVRPYLGDRGGAADHRHDPLVAVVEGSRAVALQLG